MPATERTEMEGAVADALATPERFLAWLVEASTPEPGLLFPSWAREVGYRAACGRCPIAEFLTDTFGLRQVEAGEEQITWWGGSPRYRQSVVPPGWVRRFIHITDEPVFRRPARVWAPPSPVTAGECIFVVLHL